MNKKEQGPEFFTREEIEFFKKWKSRFYDYKNDEHKKAKKYLMSTVWEKNKYLGNRIIEQLHDFELEANKIWHKLGRRKLGNKTIPAMQFKSYTWIKIFRNVDKGKQIYFTFGINVYPNCNALTYKIDCQRERGKNKLSSTNVRLFYSLISKSAEWNEIPFKTLLTLNWESLTKICTEFIKKNLEVYDIIVNAICSPGRIKPSTYKNKLIWRDKPKNGLNSIPERKKTFQGTNIDFIAKTKNQKALGNKGEQLVKKNEIEYLTKIGRINEAGKVKIKKDGEGYDIISYDRNGSEKYIEVKTTTGSEYSPFFLSDTEKDFMRVHKGRYSIYRVYNYNMDNNCGECFEIKDNVKEQLLMKPIQYRVLLKEDNF